MCFCSPGARAVSLLRIRSTFTEFWRVAVHEVWELVEREAALGAAAGTRTAQAALSVQAEEALLCSWLALDAAAHKTLGSYQRWLQDFFFFSRVATLGLHITVTASSLIYYLARALENEANADVVQTSHSSQIGIMPIDSEVLSSLPWLSRQPYVW